MRRQRAVFADGHVHCNLCQALNRVDAFLCYIDNTVLVFKTIL